MNFDEETRCPYCGDIVCGFCDGYDADVDRHLIAKLRGAHISVDAVWWKLRGAPWVDDMWEECGQDTWAQATGADEPLGICDEIVVPSASRLWLPRPRGFERHFTVLSFNDVRRGVSVEELTDGYRAYAATLFTAGVTDTRVWREFFDAGIPAEYATEVAS